MLKNFKNKKKYISILKKTSTFLYSFINKYFFFRLKKFQKSSKIIKRIFKKDYWHTNIYK